MDKVHRIRLGIAPTGAFLPPADLGALAPRVAATAADMREVCLTGDMRANPAHLAAAARFGLYERGFHTEVLATVHGGLASMGRLLDVNPFDQPGAEAYRRAIFRLPGKPGA